MSHLLLLGLVASVVGSPSGDPVGGVHSPPRGPDVVVHFDSEGVDEVPTHLQEVVHATAAEVAEDVAELLPGLLPGLGDRITVTVTVIDRDLSRVGGVTGRAEAPGMVLVELSAAFPGGLSEAVRVGLASVLYHEFHHLARGWTIRENRFGPGIPTAIVNEGLASVFAETCSGVIFERFAYPQHADEWLAELMELPIDADYDTWMNEHPDGRMAIGYRIGRYVVHEVMRRSGRSIVELSGLPPERVLALALD